MIKLIYSHFITHSQFALTTTTTKKHDNSIHYCLLIELLATESQDRIFSRLNCHLKSV